jgi:serine phosphatase RsbU (regulator of sigma subunit)
MKRRFSIGNASLRIFARSSYYKTWIPEYSEVDEQVKKLISASRMESRIVTSTIQYDNRPYLAACFPGIKLRDIYLICLYPLDEISNQISKLRNQIGIGAILILCFSVLTGLLLTETFLMPIGELQTGLEALRKRDSEHRVVIDNKDELGELGETFNQMMEEVKEMLLAAAVQQCLIPQELPEVSGYQIDLFNHMATDVGGDYADFFELPDRKYLLVLGDVTGHGVSSSILTAMVKALVFKFSRVSPDLPTTLKAISHMIFDLLKHRKLMTFCAVILDPEKNEFYLSNAGHPFPFLCSNDNTFEAIEHQSLPLGVSKKRSVYTVSKGSFKPNDTLILYTDGIAEAASPTGAILGFDTIAKIVCKNIEKEPKEIRQVLVKTFFDHTQSTELEDDLTTVIIKRI